MQFSWGHSIFFQTDYTVWADLSASLSYLLSIFGQAGLDDKLNQFIVRLYSKVGTQLGWEGKEEEDHLTQMLRSLVIPRLGKAGHDDTISEACRRFNAFAASGYKEGLVADLRSGVYSIVLFQLL
jgi:puromycin-sensitive aminopeptidase